MKNSHDDEQHMAAPDTTAEVLEQLQFQLGVNLGNDGPWLGDDRQSAMVDEMSAV